MVNSSSQKFLNRGRAPRVQIEYDMELYGAEKKIELPFVVGVMADLSGDSLAEMAPVEDRRFVEIDSDNLNDRLRSFEPRVAFQVPNLLLDDGSQITVDLNFESMHDFSPSSVVNKVPGLHNLFSARTDLSSLLSYMDGRPSAEDLVTRLVTDPSIAVSTDFKALLREAFSPRSEVAVQTIEKGLATLVTKMEAYPSIPSTNALEALNWLIAELDQSLSRQLNEIMHHEKFLGLEGAWRGLAYLVHKAETGETLRIRVLNISKKDLSRTLSAYKGFYSNSPLFKKLYEDEYGQFGGQPYGCLIGDYFFDHRPRDVSLLTELTSICAAMLTPFIGGVSPSMFGMYSFQELSNPRDLSKIFSSPEYADWKRLRDLPESKFVALSMPRFLARLPYGSETDPVEEFTFTEDVHDQECFCWANSCYAMAANICDSFTVFGWCTQIRGIESGGLVEGLPMFSFPSDDGGVEMRCPTEISINDRREAELSSNGFMPIIHRKNTDMAIYMSANSVNKPPEYDDPSLTETARRAASLPYLFPACRFSHYLKCIVRDKIGSFSDRAELEEFLNKWILQYTKTDQETSSEEESARYPLTSAEIIVEEGPASHGGIEATMWISTHYQMQGMTAHRIGVVILLPGLDRM